MLSKATARVLLGATLGVALGLSGCSSMFGGGSSQAPTASSTVNGSSNTAVSAVLTDASGLAGYLEMMRQLAEGDALTRAELFNAARDGAEFAPTRENRLRYALALSVPGHAGSDPVLAAQRLREFVAAGATLPAEQRVIAEIQLQFSEHLQVLVQNNAEMRAELAAAEAEAEAEQTAAAAAAIAELQAENRRLMDQLEEANSMLDTITNIEESISERESP